MFGVALTADLPKETSYMFLLQEERTCDVSRACMQKKRDEKGKASTSTDGKKRAETHTSRVDKKTIHLVEEEDSDSDDEQLYDLCVIKKHDDASSAAELFQIEASKDVFKVMVNKDGREVQMQVGTGAAVSVIGEAEFKSIFGTKRWRQLKASSLRLKTYTEYTPWECAGFA